jgi:hypothetical protein
MDGRSDSDIPAFGSMPQYIKKSSICKVFRGLNLHSLPAHLSQSSHMGYKKTEKTCNTGSSQQGRDCEIPHCMMSSIDA